MAVSSCMVCLPLATSNGSLSSRCCNTVHVQRVLSAYAGELLKRLPKTATGGTSAQPPYAGTDWHVKLPEEEEGVLCSILATAEYCRWGLALAPVCTLRLA